MILFRINCCCVYVTAAFLRFLFLKILNSSEIPLKVKRFKLIDGAADLDNFKVFRRFPPAPTFVLHNGKTNSTRLKNAADECQFTPFVM